LWASLVYRAVEGLFAPFNTMTTLRLGSTAVFVFLLIPPLFLAGRSHERVGRHHATWSYPFVAGGLAIWILWLLAGYFARFGYHVSSTEVWLLAALYGALGVAGWVLRKRMTSSRYQVLFLLLCWGVTSIAWALILANRQYLAVPIPFFFAYLLLQEGWRKTLLAAAVFLLTLAAVILPFVLQAPTMFYSMVVGIPMHGVNVLPGQPWNRVIGALGSGFSVMPALYAAGLARQIMLIQFVGVAILGLLALVTRPGLAATMRLMAMVLVFVLLTNSVAEVYMYPELLIIVAFAALASQLERQEPILAPTVSRAKVMADA
jgi:hypothetical protein